MALFILWQFPSAFPSAITSQHIPSPRNFQVFSPLHHVFEKESQELTYTTLSGKRCYGEMIWKVFKHFTYCSKETIFSIFAVEHEQSLYTGWPGSTRHVSLLVPSHHLLLSPCSLLVSYTGLLLILGHTSNFLPQGLCTVSHSLCSYDSPPKYL